MADLFDLLAQGRLPELRDALAIDPAAAWNRNAAGASLLAQAAYIGNFEAIALIRAVLNRLDPYESIILGDVDSVRAALDSHWDVNAPSPDGFSGLGLAAFFKRPEIFDILLPLTRDVNQRANNPQQVAALHAAAAVGQAGMVEKLLRAGADPNLPQADGFLPMHAAAHSGDAVIAGLLLLFGASPTAANAKGRSPVDIAREAGHDWLAERLAALGRGGSTTRHERDNQLSP
jgi:ankyrin repeat protein